MGLDSAGYLGRRSEIVYERMCSKGMFLWIIPFLKEYYMLVFIQLISGMFF